MSADRLEVLHNERANFQAPRSILKLFDPDLRSGFILALGGMILETNLKIGEFAKLSGVTLKTVLHYHKIGLLAEARRSPSGYRLYGPDELNRLRSIKRLKSLGLSLERIKGILGDPSDHKSFREVLLSLQTELLNQIDTLAKRADKIQKLLDKDQADLNEDAEDPPSFQMILGILGKEAQEQYLSVCPQLYDQERKIYGVMDDLQWGFDYQDSLREVAEYFRDHPDQYQQSLDYGPQITAIADLSPDSPLIDELAHKYGQFLKSLPFFEKLLSEESGLKCSLESLWSDMFAEILSPAQMKLIELLRQYIVPEE